MGSIARVDFDAPAGKVIQPASLAHVVLRTNNFKKLRDFYLAFLGSRVQHETDQLCFLTYDEEHHRIAIVTVPGTADKDRHSCGLEHIAFTFNSISDLLLAYRQRMKLGIKPFWCVNHGPTTSIYYKDTDGNVLETQADNCDTVEEANAWMMSPEFAANPIGVTFDPEDYITRIKNGESEESLKKRPVIGVQGLDAIPAEIM